MAAGRYNITIEQGATFSRSMTYSDNNGSGIDISGATVTMQIRENPDSSTVILTASTGADGRIELTDASAGKFSITISASDTSALSFRKGVYQLEVAFTDGTADRILEGSVNLSKEVVR